MLAGAALGAAAVYTLEGGDLAQAHASIAPKVRKRMRAVQKEVAATVDDVARDVRCLRKQHARSMERLQREGEAAVAGVLPALERQLADGEQKLAPVLQSEYERGQRELDRLAVARPAQGDLAGVASRPEGAGKGGRRRSSGRRHSSGAVRPVWWGEEDDELSG